MTASNATMTSVTNKRGRRGLAVGIAATAALGLFVGGLGATASADTGGDNTSVSVTVASTLDLTITSDPFELNGPAGAVVTVPDAVAYTVTTNNLAGYNVTVQAAADVLTGASIVDGTDTIPVGAMTVDQAGSIAGAPEAIEGPSGAPVEVQTKATRSASDGDDYFNDYSILIPNVTADTYTVQLNYVLTAGV